MDPLSLLGWAAGRAARPYVEPLIDQLFNPPPKPSPTPRPILPLLDELPQIGAELKRQGAGRRLPPGASVDAGGEVTGAVPGVWDIIVYRCSNEKKCGRVMPHVRAAGGYTSDPTRSPSLLGEARPITWSSGRVRFCLKGQHLVRFRTGFVEETYCTWCAAAHAVETGTHAAPDTFPLATTAYAVPSVEPAYECVRCRRIDLLRYHPSLPACRGCGSRIAVGHASLSEGEVCPCCDRVREESVKQTLVGAIEKSLR